MPAQRGRGGSSGQGQGSAVPKHVAMHWVQCLKRVFGIEINPCKHCGAAVKIIASIEDPEVIGGFSSICMLRPAVVGPGSPLCAATLPKA